MRVFHNKLRYIVWRGDEETGGLIGCPVEPRGFMLAMVAIRSDGWVAFVDLRAVEQFTDEFLNGPDKFISATIIS